MTKVGTTMLVLAKTLRRTNLLPGATSVAIGDLHALRFAPGKNLDRGLDLKPDTRFFAAGPPSNRSRLRRHTEASPETSGHCTKAAVPFGLPCRLSMNTRMDEAELCDRGRAQHEWVEIRQAHAPIH
jgi:hypothetical protein